MMNTMNDSFVTMNYCDYIIYLQTNLRVFSVNHARKIEYYRSEIDRLNKKYQSSLYFRLIFILTMNKDSFRRMDFRFKVQKNLINTIKEDVDSSTNTKPYPSTISISTNRYYSLINNTFFDYRMENPTDKFGMGYI